MKRQEPLLNIAGEVQNFADSHGKSGFAGVSTDVYRDTVDIYWRGPIPAQLITIANSHLQAHVSIHSAPYSQGELDAAKGTLTKLLQDRRVQFASIGRKADGTGLTLGRPAQPTINSTTNTLINGAISAVGIPVEVADEVPVQTTSRFADSVPFWGGNLIGAGPNSGPYCSGGFPASGPNNQWFLVTAWHCANAVSGAWYTGAGTFIGQNAGIDVTHDAMRVEIPPPPPNSLQRVIYTGASIADPANESAAIVSGVARPSVGDFVCTSGAFSGELCGIRIVAIGRDTQTCDESGNCFIFHSMAVGEQQDHLNAGGNGDSGGPVFHYADGRAVARGVLSGAALADKSAACTGVPTGNGRRCSWQVTFADIMEVTLGLNVGI